MSQFTDATGRQTLADFISVADIYPAGRLDSEGLLLLTTDGRLQNRISHPEYKLKKIYWAQVDGKVTEDAIAKLRRGVELKDGITGPAEAKIIPEPASLWPRNPPIRIRAAIPPHGLSWQLAKTATVR